jgi:hypothetical protein
MTARVRIISAQFAALRRHLHEPEQVAFAFASFARGRFDIVEVQAMGGRDIASRSDRHVELREDVRPALIRSASDRGLSLIEAHSHGPRGHAAFSPSDMRGFHDWVPHLWWRLGGMPYAALVMAGEAWDGLAWISSPTEAQPVCAIEVSQDAADMRLIVPSGATFTSLARGDARVRRST